MVQEVTVYIRSRVCKSGRTTYHLRWIDQATNKWVSKKVGKDKKRAERMKAETEKSLNAGTYTEMKNASWDEFTQYHVSTLATAINRKIAERVLKDFAITAGCSVRKVTSATVKAYVAKLREKGNAAATINKACRYLRHAFNVAVEDGFMPKNPIAKAANAGKRWKWEKVAKKKFKGLKQDQEQALLDKAAELVGWRFQAFLYVALHTGGRVNELLSLDWANVDFDEATLTFPADRTKDREDRTLYPTEVDLDILRRLKLQTQQQGGPFKDWTYDATYDSFVRVRKAAGLAITMHDLRRCFITNLIRSNVELTAVQKLAGHSTILTTLAYYNAVHDDPDLRAACAKLRDHKVG